MTGIWAEIDKLRKDIAKIEKKVSRQNLLLAQNPKIRIGDIISTGAQDGERVYGVQSREVGTTNPEAYINVKTLPGDPGPPASKSTVALYIDGNGERYILPESGRIILVQDQGSDTGRHVEKSSAGVVSVPVGTETLALVISEPDSNFHSSTPPTKSGRIYPGMKLKSLDGVTGYYLIFLAGHGDEDETFDIDIGGGDTLRIITDFAGKFISGEVV